MGGRGRRSGSNLDTSLIIDQPRTRRPVETYVPTIRTLRVKPLAPPTGRSLRNNRGSVKYDDGDDYQEDEYKETASRRSTSARRSSTRPKRESTATYAGYGDEEEEPEMYEVEDRQNTAQDVDQEMYNDEQVAPGMLILHPTTYI